LRRVSHLKIPARSFQTALTWRRQSKARMATVRLLLQPMQALLKVYLW
jgi:hypothetical protein